MPDGSHNFSANELYKTIDFLEKQYDKSFGEGDPSPLMDVVNTIFKKIEKNRNVIPKILFSQLTRSNMTCQTRYNSFKYGNGF